MNPVIEFKEEVCDLCRKYGVSISHEDCQGGFIIEPYSKQKEEWFMDAEDKATEIVEF
jgi:hypothetical protein